MADGRCPNGHRYQPPLSDDEDRYPLKDIPAAVRKWWRQTQGEEE